MNQGIKFRIPDPDDQDRDASPVASRPREATVRHRYAGATGLRLGILCLLLALVIYAMNHASKPESWDWLFQFEKVELDSGNSTTESDSPVISPHPSGPDSGPAGDRDVESKENGTESTKANSSIDSTLKTPLADMEQAFWVFALEQLEGTDQIRLFNLVDSATRQQRLLPGSTAAINPVFSRIRKARSEFVEQMGSALPVETFDQTWNGSLLPAMEAVIREEPDPALINDAVKELRSILNMAALTLVRDKTPVDRGREAYAWFSEWAQVFEQPLESSAGQTVTVPQLLTQPDVWRGQSIDIEGTALRVERVQATRNALGIERYYVIWIKPDHPSIYPWCVYSLIAPESLMGEPDEKMRTVEQRVKTTARFFKNRLFNSDAGSPDPQQGRGTEAAFSPVLLTTTVEYPTEQVAETRPPFRLPQRNIVFLTVGLIIGFACLVAVTVYRGTLSGRSRPEPNSENLVRSFSLLQDDERVETTLEKLQKMAERDDATEASGESRGADQDA